MSAPPQRSASSRAPTSLNSPSAHTLSLIGYALTMRAVQTNHDNAVSSTVYGSRSAATGIPRFEMGEDELDPRLAQRFVKDELLMSGTPALNLASFVRAARFSHSGTRTGIR